MDFDAIKSPKYYSEKLNELNINFFMVLDEVIKMYPIYKSNPDYPEYQNMYAIDMGNLETVKKEFFLLNNSIEKANELLNGNVKKFNEQIDILDKKNKSLREKYKFSSNSIHSAEGLIGQKQEIYNEKVLNLIFLILGVTGIAVMNYKEF
jgi:hypothetical protein